MSLFRPTLKLRDARKKKKKKSGSHQRRLDGQVNLSAISSGAPPAIKLLPWQPLGFWNTEAAERLPLDLTGPARRPSMGHSRVATYQLCQCLIPCLFVEQHPGCYHVIQAWRQLPAGKHGAQRRTHPASHFTAIADVSGRHGHLPLPLGRRTPEAARSG